MSSVGFVGSLLVAGLPAMLLLAALGIISMTSAFAIGIVSLVLGIVLVVAAVA